MAKLNEKQQRLLQNVAEAREQLSDSLERMHEDYLFADYRAKAPIRAAVESAQAAGVPFKRIAEEGFGFTYPNKLTTWLRPPDAVVNRLINGTVAEKAEAQFEATVSDVRTVARDPATGVFKVVYLGSTYEVRSTGTEASMWSAPEAGVPEGVYEIIGQEYPQWVLIEDDDEDY